MGDDDGRPLLLSSSLSSAAWMWMMAEGLEVAEEEAAEEAMCDV